MNGKICRNILGYELADYKLPARFELARYVR